MHHICESGGCAKPFTYGEAYSELRLTFMHSHPAVVTLNNLVCVLAVVTQTDTADKDMLSTPGLGPLQQSILGGNKPNRAAVKATYLNLTAL